MKGWTTIAVREETHKGLTEMKEIKSPGKLENYDDVIRRLMGWSDRTDETEGEQQ